MMMTLKPEPIMIFRARVSSVSRKEPRQARITLNPIMIVRANARVSLNPIMIMPVPRRPVSRHPIMISGAGRAQAFCRVMMMMTLLGVVSCQRIA